MQLRVHVPCRAEAELLGDAESWEQAFLHTMNENLLPSRITAEYARLEDAADSEDDSASTPSEAASDPEQMPPRDDFMEAVQVGAFLTFCAGRGGACWEFPPGAVEISTPF